MSDWVLQLYHRLPAPAQAAAAGLRGLYLRSWRYGRDTERLVEEALEREQWKPQRWQAWREERLAYVLHRAATRVPYYREQWAARRRRGDHSSPELLANWPLLEKELLRRNPHAFVADDCDVGRMFHEYTSGTTGKSLDLWWSRDTVRRWYALFEARWRRWYGVSRHDRWAILGGQLVTPLGRRRPPFWVWNPALQQLYLSSFHLADNLLPYYLDALARHRIQYLWGYTSCLNVVAQHILRSGRRDLKMRVVITNAEPVLEHQREAIAEAFQCPVRETYGMSEIVAAGGECAEGRLHVWPEVGWIEVLEEGVPVAPAEAGELVCTGLFNADMPLVRYRVGDRSSLLPDSGPCACGRRLPSLAGLQGRTNDLLIAEDGRKVYWLNPVFYGLPVREAQIIQEKIGQVRIRYAPAADFTPGAARSIVERLRARLGRVEVTLERVEEVPRGTNGKFQVVICQLSPEERAAGALPEPCPK
jgi:phenylacetate-CoA ligase